MDSDPGVAESEQYVRRKFLSSEYPIWAFDGSSTLQASKGDDSDMQLVPVATYADPFLGGKHRLVLCEVNDQGGKPAGE